ncbi:hypothetical protein RND81_14G092500 [Saponaria officinalis]|uniref:DUF7787 domain-containing protein n=1 Tax=Saponaria officinalis TaxID=3572 RepID=A0AAW1GMR9_SAPOF
MPKISGRGYELISKNLRLENYEAYYNNSSHPSSVNLNVPQLNEILHLHGYLMLRRECCRKGKILAALSEIKTFLNPKSSTLNDTLPPCTQCLSLDEVKADLAALNWQEEFPVESLESISFGTITTDTNVQDIQPGGQMEKKRRKRVKKVKERVVFDALHLTKPRSKNKSVKRKRLSDINDNIGSGSACSG